MSLRSRRSVLLITVLLALAACGAGLAYAFRNELRYGRLAPPTPNFASLDPALAHRLRVRTDAVIAAPYSAEAWGMLGVAYDVHDMFNEAIPCYERAIALDRHEFRWPYFLGLSMRLGDRSKALENLQRAAEVNARYAPLQYFIGDALLQQPDLDRAHDAFERALQIDPTLVAAQLGLAKIALARSDATAALKHLNEALALHPQTSEVHSLFVEAYRLTGDEAAQQEHADLESTHLGIETVPDKMRATLLWNERITLQWRQARCERQLMDGRTDLAVAEMQQAVSDAPESVAAHAALGEVFSRLGRNDEAIAEYERAVKLAPEDASAQNSLGSAYARAQRFDAAQKAFELAVKLDPTLQQARNNLGLLLSQTGQTERGLELLAESCKALPNDIGAHINYATALKEANRLEEASQVLREVTKLDPTLVRGHFELGLTLAQLGRSDEAIEEFRRVVAAEPARAAGHINLVRSLGLSGRDEECIAACRAGLTAVPNEVFLQRSLAWELATASDLKLRNGAEALEIARRLCDDSKRQDPDLLRVLAAALAESGDFTNATKCVSEALALVQPHVEKPGAADLIADLERCRALYEAGQSYRKRS